MKITISWMRFRSKLFGVVFIVGLLPAVILLLISSYLLDSTLDKIGATGFESSVEAAGSMVDDAESEIGDMLSRILEEDIPWDNQKNLDEWRRKENLDLIVRQKDGLYDWSGSDSLKIDIESHPDLLSKPGLRHLESKGQSMLLFAVGDSAVTKGCGVIMPVGYAERGRRLSGAISAAASLSIYKKFSIQLLSAVTGAGLLFIIIAGFLLSRIVSRQLVKPLESLTEGARRLGGGDLDYRVELKSGDEFAGLAASFNRMASEIAENQKKLIEAERIAAWREVARRIAHEIRNPITPVAVEIYRIQDMLSKLGDKDDREISGSLENVSAQIEALKELADHFSAFAKEPELRRQKCSIEDVIKSAVKLYEEFPNISITTTIPSEIPQVELDYRMMARVFGNIIKNSVEASPESAKIDINASMEGGNIKITVKDNGPGFPSEKLENIDTPYITTKKSGTGLGLAIIKKIVEEHGGQLRIYNQDGAVTVITLPIG